VSAETAHLIDKQVSGVHRKLYASTLNILDQSVGHIKDALEDVGMLDNTYIVFASDNGGCYLGGGRNAPLRGNKATMLEGGTKVDAFMYSPLFKDNFAGTKYNGLMHVSDWFPTILNMVGVDFQEREGFELDGVSQIDGFQGEKKRPRIYMLYNSYTNVANVEFDMWTNGPFAIRNEQYKLVHYFNSDTYAGYQLFEETLEDDQLWTSKTKECKSVTSFNGEFTYALYDLVNDPYETNNLYDSTDEEIVTAKNELYELMQAYNDGAALDVVDMMEESAVSKKKWQAAGDYVVPWTDVETKLGKQLDSTGATYPSFCGSSSEFLTQ
jgi:arylsulfatase A-like enzyme